MARQINRLNARKLPITSGLHADGNGLYLKVKPTGAQSWVFIYRFKGKRREKGLGPYPSVSLAEARAKARELQQSVRDGIDPLHVDVADETFGDVTEALLKSLAPSWKGPKQEPQWRASLTQHAADLWNQPVDQIDTEAVLKVLNPIWMKIPETASRVRSRIERVLDAAKVRGLRSGENPARWRGHLEVLLPKKPSKRNHHTALAYQEVPAFVAALRKKKAYSARAMEFLILTAARSSEVTEAPWTEFDVKGKVWTISGDRMKGGKEHRVPLTPRMLELLEEVRLMGGDRPFALGKDALDTLLRRMNDNAFTTHGFRSSFRDWAGEETDFPRELAEAALAHTVGNAVERAYRRGDALDKRRAMMEAWEAYLEEKSAESEGTQEKQNGDDAEAA